VVLKNVSVDLAPTLSTGALTFGPGPRWPRFFAPDRAEPAPAVEVLLVHDGGEADAALAGMPVWRTRMRCMPSSCSSPSCTSPEASPVRAGVAELYLPVLDPK
jgi:hypothetical protein